MNELAQSNAKELSDTSANVTSKENFSDDRKLKEVKEIQGTPFAAVKFEDKWFLVIGNYRISELFDTYEEVVEDSKDASWDRLISVMEIVFSKSGLS